MSVRVGVDFVIRQFLSVFLVGRLISQWSWALPIRPWSNTSAWRERTSNEKAERGLYRFASGIGKAPGKRDMKNIFRGQMERLDYREIGKAIEWPIGGGFSSLEIR